MGKVRGASSSPFPREPKQDGGQDAPPAWEFFDPFTEIEIHDSGHLPHWSQGAVWYFITYRLADALPSLVVEKIKAQREQWKTEHDLKNLSKEERIEYYKLFSERYEELLNAGSGSCVLRDPQNAGIVTDAFHFFENKRYALDEYVVMPNHVHILVKPLNGHRLADILHSWKSFTATAINRRLGRSGQLWMHESYDHIVRSEQAMHIFRRYIRENPSKGSFQLPIPDPISAPTPLPTNKTTNHGEQDAPLTP